MHTTKAYIGLGSNLGDRAGNLLLAVRGLLDACLPVARLSSIYETEPVGVSMEQPKFLNMVAELAFAEDHDDDTRPSPEQLLARLLRIEYAMGRRRDAGGPLAPRNIDLDLLLYGDACASSDYLTLPHPRLHLRRFVLVPLCELAAEALHPTRHKSFKVLLSEASDVSTVERWNPADAEGARG